MIIIFIAVNLTYNACLLILNEEFGKINVFCICNLISYIDKRPVLTTPYDTFTGYSFSFVVDILNLLIPERQNSSVSRHSIQRPEPIIMIII